MLVKSHELSVHFYVSDTSIGTSMILEKPGLNQSLATFDEGLL